MKQRILGALTSALTFFSPSTSVPYETDLKFMRLAIDALPSLCFYNAYGSVIVNASSQEVICKGHNQQLATGDPTEHGEVDAIRNCVDKFTKDGLSPVEIAEQWQYTWLYTTAEPCPMCAATCLQSGFARVVFATSGSTLYKVGWREYLVTVPSKSLALAAKAQPGFGRGRPVSEIVGGVGANETDPLLAWQFQPDEACPRGCSRKGETCEPF